MLEKAVFTLLSPFVSGRVYAAVAPQKAPAPFIIIQRVAGERWRSLQGPSGMGQARIQVDAYANDYYGAKALAVAIENILDGYRGIVLYGATSPQQSVRIGGCSLLEEVDMLDETDDPKLFRVSSDYLFTYQT